MNEKQKRFKPCDGASIGAHPPAVFLERKLCLRGKASGKAVFFECVFCKIRSFARGLWLTAPLLTAAQCRAMVPANVQAIDGNGVAI